MTGYREAAEFLLQRLDKRPDIALILGSGLGEVAAILDDPTIISCGEIPGFPRSTVVGHWGRLLAGKVGRHTVWIMQGRFHYYEGYDMAQLALPIRTLIYAGIKLLVLTNAAGALRPERQRVGDLMLIRDQLCLFAPSVLRGANIDELGPRFVDLSDLYPRKYREICRRAAIESNWSTVPEEGVYAYLPGPHFETPADIKALQILGADAVGMSTVPEAILAAHGGVPVLGISCLTNYAAGLSATPLSHEEVGIVGARAATDMAKLLDATLRTIEFD